MSQAKKKRNPPKWLGSFHGLRAFKTPRSPEDLFVARRVIEAVSIPEQDGTGNPTEGCCGPLEATEGLFGKRNIMKMSLYCFSCILLNSLAISGSVGKAQRSLCAWGAESILNLQELVGKCLAQQSLRPEWPLPERCGRPP